MPYNDPDPTDPNILVGVVLPAERETMREMAYAFAEEFARMGYDEKQIVALFKTPFYAGAHGAYRALGAEAVQAIAAECLAAWGGIRFSILDFGFSIENGGGESKIGNPKSKMVEGSGGNG